MASELSDEPGTLKPEGAHQRIAITPAQVRAYRDAGWVRLPAILRADEIDVIRSCCIAAEHDALTEKSDPPPGVDPAVFAYQANPRYRQMFRNQSELRLRFPQLRPLVTKLASVARQLLNVEDVRILWDKTFTKPPAHEGTRQTVWHQDLPYVPVDRRGLMTIWIPMQPVTAESGAMRFVSGSHRIGSLGRRDLVDCEPMLEQLLTPADLELVGRPVTVPLGIGDVTVHDGLCLHGAGPNTSDAPRRAWSCTYVPGDALWNGAPWSVTEHGNYYGYDLKPFQPFDHPDLMVD